MISGSGRCHYHPERAGLGICIECRHVICQECTTQFDGINRCASCLGRRLAKSRALPTRREWSAGSVFLALASFLLVWGALYGVFNLVGR
ncbi:MAG TPA: hypothetical protein VK420_14980 [Longimicrobium sp.]|nr:hypothetical protein [Longimicrobium sp.]